MRLYLVLLSFVILFMPQVFAEEQSHTYDYYQGSLKFDTNLDNISCDSVIPKPMVVSARSLDIDGMNDYFFIILGKTNSGDYNYLQIKLPDNDGIEHRESYLLDLKMKNQTSIGGGLYQDYPQLAIYLESDSKMHDVSDSNYKRFLVGKSLHVVPFTKSLGSGEYDLHAILFQSDRSNWIIDPVCAVSVSWPISVDNDGNVLPSEPQTNVGKIYPIITDKKSLEETDKIIEQANQKKNDSQVQINESLDIESEYASDNEKLAQDNHKLPIPVNAPLVKSVMLAKDSIMYGESFQYTITRTQIEGVGGEQILTRIINKDTGMASDWSPVTLESNRDTIITSKALGQPFDKRGDYILEVKYAKQVPGFHSYSDFHLINDADTTNQQGESYLLSPNQQHFAGISVQDVKCNDGLELLKNPSLEMPACVKYDSVQKLVERGWINLS